MNLKINLLQKGEILRLGEPIPSSPAFPCQRAGGAAQGGERGSGRAAAFLCLTKGMPRLGTKNVKLPYLASVSLVHVGVILLLGGHAHAGSGESSGHVVVC